MARNARGTQTDESGLPYGNYRWKEGVSIGDPKAKWLRVALIYFSSDSYNATSTFMYRLILVLGLGICSLVSYAQPFNAFLSLDGSDDYADRSMPGGLIPSASDFTVEGWIRTCGSVGMILDARENDNGPGVEIEVVNGGQIKVTVQGGGGVLDVTDSTTDYSISPSGFHHLAFVHRAPDYNYLFVDGRLFAEFVQPFAADDAFFLGRSDDGATGFFDGYMDEFRVSSEARYFSAFNPAGPFAIDATTLALWHFDDPSATTTFLDDSGFGNDLSSHAGATSRIAFAVGGGGTVCPGSGTSISVSGAIGYSWAPITGLDDPMSASPMASPESTTYYTVTATDSNSCLNIGLVGVVVRNEPVIIASSAMPEICEGDVTQLFAEGGVSFLWSTGDISQNPLVSPAATTTYSVEATDVFGCTGNAEVTVLVRSCEAPSGLENTNIMEWSIGPNPTWGTLFLQFALADASELNLQVVDALGRTVRQFPAESLGAGTHRRTLDTQLAPGSYWLLMDAGTAQQSIPFVVSF